MGLSCGFRMALWHLACFCIIIQTAINNQAQAQQQQKRSSSRITSSRSFGTNVKTSGSNGIDFDCPEEFGYYPHPTDCTQYYVCVFGGALLESCTGGLMYSHELQTCDWPRNVGCEVVEVDSGELSNSAANIGGSSGGTRSSKHQQQQQSINSQHVPSRIRFGSAFSSPAGTTPSPKAAVPPPQYHRQPPQVIQAQVQSLPQHAGSVIGTRGQPKPFGLQEDIAQLYADAHDTLPPVEEEESDRQQRVYRGQPSTVSQVQRDRDGIIHQASINAIPNHGKIGSYAFGSQYRPDSSSPSSPQSALPASHYVQEQQQQHQSQQQRPVTAVLVEAIPQSIQSSNRNYYNTTALLNHAVYEPLSQQQHQQQEHEHLQLQQQQQQQHAVAQQHQIVLQQQQQQQHQQQQQLVQQQDHQQPLQQQQQQQLQAPQQNNQEQSSYEQYYSVYDDDLDLYRDIEYQQQQPPPPPQQSQPEAQQPQQPHYQPASVQQQQPQQQSLPPTPVRQQTVVQQSTYRPLDVLTTPTPIRETYNKVQKKPAYNDNQHSLIYNTEDYDEDLIAQIEQDNVYDQPTRPPTRSKTHANIYQKNQQRSQPKPLPTPDKQYFAKNNNNNNKNKNNNNTPSTTNHPPTTQTPRAITFSPPTTTTTTTKTTTSTSTSTTTQRPYESFANSQYLDSEETFVTVVSKPHKHNTNDESKHKYSNTRNSPNSPNPPYPPNPQNSPNTQQAQKSVLNFRTVAVGDVETISDASQNIRVQTAEPFKSVEKALQRNTKTTPSFKNKSKFFEAIDDVVDYGLSTHENSVRAINDKTISNGKYVRNENVYRSSSKHSDEYYDKAPSESKVQQNNRLQNFILSDVAPQSFKPAPTTEVASISDSEAEPILELISGESSSTTLRYPTNIVFEPKPFKYNLQTGSNGFSLRAQSTAEEIDKPIYERQQSEGAEGEVTTRRAFVSPSRSTSTTTTTSTTSGSPPQSKGLFVAQDVNEDEIVPTTYAPPLHNTWRLGRFTSVRPLKHFVLETDVEENYHVLTSSGSEQSVVAALKETSTVRPTTSTTKKSTSTTTTTTPRPTSSTTPRPPPTRSITTTMSTTTTTTTPRTTMSAPRAVAYLIPTTERTITHQLQSYTPRTLTSKENIIKTTSNPAQRFVSPYKSLETILQEKDVDRYAGNALRSTAKQRYPQPTTPATIVVQSTSKPVRSYFLITQPQRNLSDAIFATASTGLRNFSVSDTILNTFSNMPLKLSAPIKSTTTTTSTTPTPEPTTTTESTTPTTMSTVIATSPIRISQSPSISNLPKTQAFGDYGSINSETPRSRGRSRFTAANFNAAAEEPPTTYAPRLRYTVANSGTSYESKTSSSVAITSNESYPKRRKLQRARIVALQGQRNTFGAGLLQKSREKYENYKSAEKQQQQQQSNGGFKYGQGGSITHKTINRKPIENESNINDDDVSPRAEALVRLPIDDAKQDNSIESTVSVSSSSNEQHLSDESTDRPLKFLFSNKYRQQTKDRTLAESLQNAGYITSTSSSAGRTNTKFDTSSVLEQLQLFLAGDSNESSAQQFVDDFSEREINAAVKEIKNLYTTPKAKATTTTTTTTTYKPPTTTTTTTLRPTTTAMPPTTAYRTSIAGIHTQLHSSDSATNTFPTTATNNANTLTNSRTHNTFSNTFTHVKVPSPTLSNAVPTSASSSSLSLSSSSSSPSPNLPIGSTLTAVNATTTTTTKSLLTPVRASRVNNAIKSSIAAAAYSASSPSASTSTSVSAIAAAALQPLSNMGSTAVRGNSLKANSAYFTNTGAAVKCSDTTSNAKCNEIPSRTNSNNNRNRGSSTYTGQERDTPTAVTSNRGTHPPRTRPTLKPSGTIVSKAQEFVDIYRYPPSRPEPLYPQPTPDKAAAKCRKDVCLLPDCACGGKDIPGDLPVETVPQIVLITFDDSVNDLNKQLYTDLFEKGRVNPNGCPITATFYVSHEWTDYSQVQNLYSDGHEMASHTVSHSFGEQFSQKKWTREIAGQREILAAYGGVKLSDVRGMRAPFLSVGGNKMYKMLYDSNFTYDSSLPVYENRPPSWPYTFDYKIFHDCMIPPCPTRSYPGVWQVPMVMWQDLNGGRCSMGDACSNPSESDGVYKMIMKNFERHYTTNRAPFGLYYHAAWFTQPHHKEGFIKFLDAINQMNDVWIVTNWQMLQWVRDPTPLSRINSFQPFQCNYTDRPKRCNNPKVCNLWHKSGVRYMKTCQPCPDIYPWTGKTGIRSSRVDNEIEDSTA